MSIVECEWENSDAVRCGLHVYVLEERDQPLTANWYTDLWISVALIVFGEKDRREESLTY
jgi:hypothetical protein